MFYDEGVSGGLLDRPAMRELLDYLDTNWQKKYCVIFDDLKRFARDVNVHFKFKAEFKSRGVELLCPNHKFDDSPEGEFVETVFAAQNQLERKQNRRQVMQKQMARLEKGYWTFCPATGYEFRKTEEHGKLLFPIDGYADVIREAITGFAVNKLIGQVDVQRFLENDKRFKSVHAGKVHLSLVERILTDPIYAGFIEYSKWGVARRKGHHKAIISEEIYFKVQEKLRKPERKPRSTDSLEFPLRRIISCNVCGKPMTGSCNRSKNPNKYYPHYTCNNKDCSATPKNITASKVEEDYIELLENIKVEPEILNLMEALARKIWLTITSQYLENKKARDKEIEGVKAEIDKYIDLIPKAPTEAIRVRFMAKIEELDARLSELEKDDTKKSPNIDEALKLALNFIGTPDEQWKKSVKEQRILLHNLIFVDNPKYSANNGFGTPNLSLPFYIKHYAMGQKNGLVEVEGVAPSSKRLKTYILQV